MTMDPDSKAKLDELIRLVEDNNKAIREVRRYIRVGHFLRVVYWIFILGTAFSAYYFAQPYLGQVKNTFEDTKSDIDGISSFLEGFKK
ncbi:MAG: hypothetical protein K9L98_03255 [Candidatus Pacebacteria bacterium]|nr:hypothetical protein [Candidatus Paceibacterota bacterium]MCF7862998.1 hypothetical protein [Candidatus Paceibacterota bacterium]